jgi:hypothetical protein
MTYNIVPISPRPYTITRKQAIILFNTGNKRIPTGKGSIMMGYIILRGDLENVEKINYSTLPYQSLRNNYQKNA